jgi:hypothetical protein
LHMMTATRSPFFTPSARLETQPHDQG